MPKSLSCGKTFRGMTLLKALPEVLHWLGELGGELEERIGLDRDANSREPRLLTAHWANISRSCPLRRCDAASIAQAAHGLVFSLLQLSWGSTHRLPAELGVCVVIHHYINLPCICMQLCCRSCSCNFQSTWQASAPCPSLAVSVPCWEAAVSHMQTANMKWN